MLTLVWYFTIDSDEMYYFATTCWFVEADAKLCIGDFVKKYLWHWLALRCLKTDFFQTWYDARHNWTFWFDFSLWIILTFTQDHRFMTKLELVQSSCCWVAGTSPNFALVDYLKEMNAKKSCKYGRYRKHLHLIVIMMIMIIIMIIVLVIVIIIIIIVVIMMMIITSKSAIQDFYNSLTAPWPVSNMYTQVARAQIIHKLCATHRALIMCNMCNDGTAQLLGLTELKLHLFYFLAFTLFAETINW